MYRIKATLMIAVLVIMAPSALRAGGADEQRDASDGDEGVTRFSLAYPTPNLYAQEAPDILEDPYLQELERRANIDITRMDIFPHTQRQEFYNLLFASGDLTDVFYLLSGWNDMPSGVLDEGIFAPLNDYLDEQRYPSLMNAVPPTAWREVSHTDGNVYGVPRYLSTPVRRTIYIRKDLLDRFGLDVPVTRDDYLNVLRAFRDGGVRYPYSGRENFAYENLFWGSFDAHPGAWLEDENGDLYPAFIGPRMREALAFYRTLYEEGLIDQEFLTNSRQNLVAKVSAGDVGMFVQNISSYKTWRDRVRANVPNGELIMVNSPVDEAGNGGMFNYGRRNRHFAINAEYEEIDGLMRFFDWTTTPEGDEFFSFGMEGVTFERDENGAPIWTPAANDEERKIRGWFGNMPRIDDMAYNPVTLANTPEGQVVLDYFVNDADDDRWSHWFVPALDAARQNADLQFNSFRAPPSFIEVAAKVIYGTEPIDAFDEFVAEWLSRGGEELLAEANAYHDQGLTYLFQ